LNSPQTHFKHFSQQYHSPKPKHTKKCDIGSIEFQTPANPMGGFYRTHRTRRRLHDEKSDE
jgi:hypothetical protein